LLNYLIKTELLCDQLIWQPTKYKSYQSQHILHKHFHEGNMP